MKPLITICTVNYNSSEFIELMLFALKKLTFNTYKVIICDNNSKETDFQKLENLIKDYENINLYRVNTDKLGSMAHGEALNELVSRIDTEYGVILDADATFLIKNWDKILIDKIDDKTPIYGTQADVGYGKPEDFPLMFAVIFKTDILKNLQVDFRPKDVKNFQDTGFELRGKYLGAGFSGGLLYDFNTRKFKKGPFSEVVCSEYYLEDNASGIIFASHFGRGSAPRSKNLVKLGGKRTLILRMVNKFLQYANILKWKHQKSKWIFICKSIIDSQ